MRSVLRTGVRCLVVAVAFTMIGILLTPSAPDRSPYLSALSDFALGSAAFAQPACENKACHEGGSGNFTCAQSPTFRCDKEPGGARCHTVAC